ncbi:MAG: CCA tRNA nucleotidyltransferase [Candidatus Limnocylindrales bacterium]
MELEGSDSVGDGPPFQVEPQAMAVLERLWHAGHSAYLVGGGVRDALMGLPVGDWDVATDARPERILHLFPGSSYQNRFGTVLAQGVEITTFRRDHRYADHRRPDSVTFSEDIFEDLARRDLTINAIAWGRLGPEAAAQLVDPADGRRDLEARLVRAVGDPGRRFDEDALRLLRAVRIAARLDFAIEPFTLRAMVDHARDIEWVSEERIASELRQMLGAATPSRALHLLRQTGILATTLPELEALPPAALEATLAALDAVALAHPHHERLALAALLGATVGEDTRSLLTRLRVGAHDVDAVVALVDNAHTVYHPAWSDADVRRYMSRVPDGLLDDLLVLRTARAIDGTAGQLERQLQERIARERASAPPLTLGDLAVDGRDLQETLGIPEGPVIGSILERLLADVIEEPALNRRGTLLTRASLTLDELQAGRGGAKDGAAHPPIR